MNVSSNINKYFWIILFRSASFLAPVLTLFYLSRGLSYFQIFFLYATITVATFIFEVPTGIIGDKYGRKTSIILGIFGWILFGVGFFFANSFGFFIVLFILLGINLTFISGSDEALIYDSLKQDKKETKDMARILNNLPKVTISVQ